MARPMHRQHFLQKMSPTIVAAVVLSTAAAASSGHPAAITKPMDFAQAGSTGGTIGKQDKPASGGEEKFRPRRTRKQVLRPSKPERQSKRMPGKSSTAPWMAVGGRWKWNATCAFGNWDGGITLAQTTANTFHGSFSGQSVVDNGIITDRTIRGKHINFLRYVGASFDGRYDAHLVSMEPPTVKGDHVDPATGACQFIATKM